MRPTVSVITATYNVAPYIGQCIESVLQQTLSDWEMIIVDDASTDETVAVVERYLSDPRIKLLRNDRNRKVSYARNRALENAQGRWIAVLDSDDWYAPQRLERLVEFAQQMHAEMVTDLSVCISESGEILGTMWSAFGKNPRQPRYYSIEEVIRSHPAFKPLIKTEFLINNNIRYLEHICMGEDFALAVEILLKGGRFAVLPEPMYFYRVRSQGNLVTTYRDDHHQRYLVCEYLCQLPEATPRIRRLLRKNFRYVTASAIYPHFSSAIKRGDWRQAWQCLKEEPIVFLRLIESLPGALYRRLSPHKRT
jgi:succinoglycan biosynthesis protein ExoO